MPYRTTTALISAALRPFSGLGGADWRERMGRAGVQVAPGGVWLHAASVGELSSARALAEALARDLPLIVTTNSITGRDLAQGWGFAAALAPLDLPGALTRFLDRTRPALALTVEAELWPNRSALLAERGVRQAMIGARLSVRSARRWGRLPGLIGPVLARMDLVSAQDADSEARLLALGLPRAALTTRANLKLFGPLREAVPAPSAQRDQTLLIASSHEDEEAALLAALPRLRALAPQARLIWAPRHPERFAPLAAALPDFARRSQGADAGAALLLADSMGEMALWYSAAGSALIAGSFGAAGGHSPWEAAGQACAILHGPHIASAAADYAALAEAGAARMVGADWPELAAALLDAPAEARAMGAAARATLEARAGDPAPLLDALRHLASGARRTDI